MSASFDIHPAALAALVEGRHGNPFSILGPHRIGEQGGVSLRVFRPWASVMRAVLPDGSRHDLEKIHNNGFFVVDFPDAQPDDFRYRLELTDYDGDVQVYEDPYRFAPHISEFDRYLWGEGTLLYAYETLGAHPVTHDGVRGVCFTVWAPNAERVSVIGNFNRWDERANPMRLLSGGLWELFIPGLTAGEVYRYDIRSHNHGWRFQKSDPFAFWSEMRPANASIVYDLSGYEWGDADWMTARGQGDLLRKPMSVYEVHLGSWRRHDDGRWLSYRELADQLIPYVQEMGFTHIELLPITEHPFDGSWGYQVTGYFAATSRFGTPHDLMYLIDRAHQAGIGIILDWVPAHFPKDGHGLNFFDGTHLYEHDHPLQREHPDWGTLIFNFGRNEVRNFLLSSALFWLKEYHIDGLRVDAVSSMIYLDFSRSPGQWIPNPYGGRENLDAIYFLREFNEVVHREVHGAFTVAEESTAWPMVSRPTYLGGLGFTFKWNMGWMHDTLEYIKSDPVYRRWKHNKLTFSLMYAFSENFVLSLSHDEVVHMKGALIEKVPGDWWQKFATLRLLFGYMWTHPGKKLLFMGAEFGQWREWSEARPLDWHLLVWETHQGTQRWMRDLNAFYRANPALWEQDFDGAGFQWINADDADNSVYSYVRYAQNRDDFVVVVLNFTPVPRPNYRIGVPRTGLYREVLNSDAVRYGGGNVTNPDPIEAHHHRHLWWDDSLSLTLPPLGIVILRPDPLSPPAELPKAGESHSGFGRIDLPAPSGGEVDVNAGQVG